MRYLLSVCLLFLFSTSYSQDSLGFYWNRVIGGTGDDIMPLQCTPDVLLQNSSAFDFTPSVLRRPDLQLAANGRLIMVNSTYSKDGDVKGLRLYADTATKGADVLVTCLDSTGRIIWKKCLGGSGNDYGTAIYVETDGYLVAGSTVSADGDFTNSLGYALPFLVKIDLNGNVLWKRTYPQGSSADMIDSRVEAVKKLPDGKYVLLINRSSALNGNYRFTTELMQVDASGNFSNLTVFAGNQSIIASGIVVRDDGSLLVAGTTAATTGPIVTPNGNGAWVSGFLTKLQFNGTAYGISWIIYPWAYNNASHTRLMDMVQTTDGSIYVSGSGFSYSGGQSKGFIYKYDSVGNFKWFRDYSSFAHRVIFSLDNANNNGILFSAFSDGVCGFNYNHVVIGRVDSTGALVWQKCTTGDDDDFGLRVKYISEAAHYVLAVTNSTILPSHTYNRNFSENGNMVCPSDLWLFKSGLGNIINGTVFLDLNGNNIQNTGEPLLPNVWVRTGKDSIRTKGAYTYTGRYTIAVDTGKYTTKVVLPAGVPFTVSPSNDVVTFTTLGNTRTTAFAVKPIGSIYDLDVHLSPIGLPRLGRDLSYKVTARNMGTQAINGNTITLVKDSRLTFVSATTPPLQVIGDTLIWNYSSFPILTEQSILISFHSAIPPALNIGDTLRLSAKVQHTQTDATPLNNSKSIEQIVVGPMDPNNKLEVHNGKLGATAYTNGEYLDYLINFQNMGTDTAFYVEVRDTLDARLDVSTMQMTASSHPAVLSVSNNNQLTWKFNTIRLATLSQNEDSSKGYIAFRVKPVSGLAVGDTIKNSASIYFEYNLPVVTDTTKTRLSAEALPVRLLSLAALPLGKQISVAWKTTSETGNRTYEVERSTDATRFEKIGVLAARQGTGIRSYTFDDYNVDKTRRYFYRLKIVGIDYRADFSPVVNACLCNTPNELTISPNPGDGIVNILLTGVKGKTTLTVYDAAGKACFSRTVMASGVFNEWADLTRLANGMYTIRIANNTHVSTQRWLKAK